MFATLTQLRLALLIALPLLRLQLRHLLLGKRNKISWILRIRLPTRRTQSVLVGANAMPAEAADLISARAREEVEVVHLQRLHTQRTLHLLLATLV